jgi:putative transposase
LGHYVRLRGGFAYLVAPLDWFSRFVLAWELCSGLETFYCLRVLEAARAAAGRAAEITNSDQGNQFTSAELDCGGPIVGQAGEP